MLDNVEVIVEDEPTAEQLAQGRGYPEPRASAGDDDETLFGLYEGVPLTRRGSDYHLVPPDRITIFRGPLSQRARDEADLARQIRVTVIHEVAHHFGIDDDRLRELGWS